MKIALIQHHAGHDRDENIRRGLQAAESAADDGAQVICFAELAFERFYPQYHATDKELSLATPVPGPITDVFVEFAARRNCVVVLNLFEHSAGQTFDSSPVIDADGSILGITRMVHITDYPGFHEQDYYAPGDRGVPVFDTRYGKIGVAICYDRHFPEYMRALAVAGAQLVVIPQAGTVGEWPEGLYEAELQVAAFQNGYFTALCNRVGKEDELEFSGESFVCNPAGKTIGRAQPAVDEVLLCDIDLQEIENCHAKQLFMKHRRPELYADWIGPTVTSK